MSKRHWVLGVCAVLALTLAIDWGVRPKPSAPAEIELLEPSASEGGQVTAPTAQAADPIRTLWQAIGTA